MSPLNHLLADCFEVRALAERLQMECRRALAAHGAATPPAVVDFIVEQERRWGWVSERAHDLAVQLERLRRAEEEEQDDGPGQHQEAHRP